MIAKAYQDETIDNIIWRVLGSASTELVNQTLELNPNLAGIILLPLGQEVILPDAIPQSAPLNDVITLWD